MKHVALYSKEVSCIHALKHLKFLQKISKKLKFLPNNGKICVYFSKKRADSRIFSLASSFFIVLILFYFTSIGSLISFCCSPLLSNITKISSALPVSQSALNNSIGYNLWICRQLLNLYAGIYRRTFPHHAKSRNYLINCLRLPLQPLRTPLRYLAEYVKTQNLQQFRLLLYIVFFYKLL